MCKSIKDTLLWYRDEAIKLSATARTDPKHILPVALSLIDDQGNRAQDALDALQYGNADVNLFSKIIANLIASVKLALNSKNNLHYKLIHEQHTTLLIKELKETYGVSVSDPTLELRTACADVITNATAELIGICNIKQNGVIETCDFDHKFIKMEDHPVRNGVSRCPQCLAIGLDAAREEIDLLKQQIEDKEK